MGKLQGKSFQLAFRSGEASITGKVRKEDNKEERNNAKTKEGKVKNRKERRDKERRREQGTKGRKRTKRARQGKKERKGVRSSNGKHSLSEVGMTPAIFAITVSSKMRCQHAF